MISAVPKLEWFCSKNDPPTPFVVSLVAPEPALVAQGPKQKASEWSCQSCPYPRGSNWHWELGRRWREARCAASASQDGGYTPNIFKNLKINLLDWTQILKKYSFSNGSDMKWSSSLKHKFIPHPGRFYRQVLWFFAKVDIMKRWFGNRVDLESWRDGLSRTSMLSCESSCK